MLVDATAFFLRDAHGVADRLRQAKQGHYRLDDARSALEPGRTKGFPKNTEVEAIADLRHRRRDRPARRRRRPRRPGR